MFIVVRFSRGPGVYAYRYRGGALLRVDLSVISGRSGLSLRLTPRLRAESLRLTDTVRQ